MTNYFRVSRGVRQGCPLSPPLFVLCVELLLVSSVSNVFFANNNKKSRCSPPNLTFSIFGRPNLEFCRFMPPNLTFSIFGRPNLEFSIFIRPNLNFS